MIPNSELKTLEQILSQARREMWVDFPGNGRSHRTHVGYQAQDDDGKIVNVALFETNANAKRADVMLVVYARNYLPRLIEEINAARQSSLCCPRCCGKFHDEDVNTNSDEFWTCPNCGAIEHVQCRGPLSRDVPICPDCHDIMTKTAAGWICSCFAPPDN